MNLKRIEEESPEILNSVVNTKEESPEILNLRTEEISTEEQSSVVISKVIYPVKNQISSSFSYLIAPSVDIVTEDDNYIFTRKIRIGTKEGSTIEILDCEDEEVKRCQIKLTPTALENVLDRLTSLHVYEGLCVDGFLPDSVLVSSKNGAITLVKSQLK
jgi:hypothetical protein